MTSGTRTEITDPPDVNGTQAGRRERRIARLYASDRQFQAADPLPEVVDGARRPGLRLPEVIETLVAGYRDRPALGQRARELVLDPTTGRTTTRLLPNFETISYGELWAQVRAVAAAWRHDETSPVNPGDFVATVGFAGPSYLTVDLVCAYLGLVSVPLQHSAPVSVLKPIIEEVEPRVLAAGAAYLDLAVESALQSVSLRHLVVFDYQPQVDEHRENLERARQRLHDAGLPVVVSTLDEVIQRGRELPPVPIYTGDTDQRLAMILYTSGSTGTPKGAMLTERTLARVQTSTLFETEFPVFNVNFMPLNHIAGRMPLAAAFLTGGTSYFVAESDLSTLFDDWALVRPTDLLLVPRVVEMLFQHFRSTVDRISLEGADIADAEQEAAIELRDQELGGRVLRTSVSTAPLAGELKAFLESCLDVHVGDLYGLTEVVPVTRDGIIVRPSVIDYKLIDVPELGYFTTDKPYPRGELLVKSENSTPGYYKRPEVTAEAFDEDGYYRTGDVMAEIAPDHVVYVDRRKNVLKLANGEFVAVANLEAVFSAAPLVRQIFVYGNSERSYLLAVIVPTAEALSQFGDDAAALQAALRQSLQQTATAAELQSYDVPADFLIETEPFSAANGLLSGVGKNLRPKLKDAYGARLEGLYGELAAAQVSELRALRQAAAEQPVLDTVLGAARAVLGSGATDVDSDAHFTDLGGDSLSALTFSNLLQELLGVEVSVGVLVSPASDLRQIADYIESERRSGSTRPTFARIHGKGQTTVYASDLTLDGFIDTATLTAATTLPRVAGEPHTVLLTGANGYLGRFVTLEWLERLSRIGGTLITIIRGNDADAARARLEKAFDSGDPQLLSHFREMAAEHLEVIVGDIGEPNLGLDDPTWQRLAESVDLIAHVGALVNHVLPYEQLFGPNVVGTAEVIKLAISAKIKPVTFMSTVAVAAQIAPDKFAEDGDIRAISPERTVDGSYANGYGNSKWAGEILLREAFDLCALPVAVFRSDMILAHSQYVGQLNVVDMFTRLLLSLLATGTAPASFYQTDAAGNRQRAHYAGVPADFVAEAVTTLGKQVTDGFHSYDVENPHDDGISLDTFVDWLIDAGHQIHRISDYNEWLTRFETTLKALPEKQRQQSVLPLLGAYREPEKPLRGAPTPTEMFQTAVRAAEIGADKDIPHLSTALIDKYVTDLQHLALLSDHG
jgi:fatty acid CoA ligase FadD9